MSVSLGHDLYSPFWSCQELFVAIHDSVPLPPPHWSTLLLRLNRVLSQQLQYQSQVAGPRGYQSPVCAAPRSVRTTKGLPQKFTGPSSDNAVQKSSNICNLCLVMQQCPQGSAEDAVLPLGTQSVVQPSQRSQQQTVPCHSKIWSSTSSIVSSSHSFSQESCSSS